MMQRLEPVELGSSWLLLDLVMQSPTSAVGTALLPMHRLVELQERHL